MKQTSIEWLIEQCPRIEMIASIELIEQAKEMHKQEIVHAHFAGWEDAYDYIEDKVQNARQAEQYYLQTFSMSEIPNNLYDSEKPNLLEISDEEIEKLQTEIEFVATNSWIEYNKKDSDNSESFYNGWRMAIEWYFKKIKNEH